MSSFSLLYFLSKTFFFTKNCFKAKKKKIKLRANIAKYGTLQACNHFYASKKYSILVF